MTFDQTGKNSNSDVSDRVAKSTDAGRLTVRPAIAVDSQRWLPSVRVKVQSALVNANIAASISRHSATRHVSSLYLGSSTGIRHVAGHQCFVLVAEAIL